MADWQTSLKKGTDFEDFCLKDISEKKYPLAYKNMNKDEYSYCDIILFNGNFSIPTKEQKKVECKFDEMAQISNNICIEVGCNGIWSGLLKTKAEYWIISDGSLAGKTTYIIKKGIIEDCIRENINTLEYKPNHPVVQENNVVKLMNLWIIPRRIFESYCEEISNINELKYDCLI